MGVFKFILRGNETFIHHRDTEDTEDAQRRRFNSLCYLCVLCVSVVNTQFLYHSS
jgi:hypothetical protein